MFSFENDILVEIPNEDLPKLANLYEKHVDWAPHVFSLIKTGIRWKESQKYSTCFTFLSPVESIWEKDGTIIILQTYHCYNIFVFSLEEDCTNLYRGLTLTNLIDYRNKNAVVFFCIHQKHIFVIEQVIKKLNLEIIKSRFMMYALPPHVSFKINKSPGVYVSTLHQGLVQQINSAWPYSFEGSRDYISSLIEMNGGYGIFLKDTNEMVAWILRYNFGHVGILQTEIRYKKRGYGIFVTQTLAKKIIQEGYWPFATISTSNLASINLFEKLGFKKVGECAYFTLKT